MDFEVEELSSPVDSQVIIWKLELPSVPKTIAKTEGAMRIYTTQRDFVGLAPLVMVSWMAVDFFFFMSNPIIMKSSTNITPTAASPITANTWTAFEQWRMKIS